MTSLPLVDQQQVCAVAYQGRLACFDATRGTLNWSRDLSSLYGLAGDGKHIYATDDKGAVHALDRSTGASVWKQDLLALPQIGGPQIVGDLVGVVDIEGYLHLMSTTNGAYVGRMATDGSAPTSQPVALRRQRAVAIVQRHAVCRHCEVAELGAPNRSAGRSAECRQVDAVQPAHANRATRWWPTCPG